MSDLHRLYDETDNGRSVTWYVIDEFTGAVIHECDDILDAIEHRKDAEVNTQITDTAPQ